MQKPVFLVFACIGWVVFATSCYYDKEDLLYGNAAPDCTTLDAKYSTAISPLMQSKCATSGCHDAATNAGGVTLESHTQVSNSAAGVKQRAVVSKNMPPSAPLSPSEIAALQCWIDAGTPNN